MIQHIIYIYVQITKNVSICYNKYQMSKQYNQLYLKYSCDIPNEIDLFSNHK